MSDAFQSAPQRLWWHNSRYFKISMTSLVGSGASGVKGCPRKTPYCCYCGFHCLLVLRYHGEPQVTYDRGSSKCGSGALSGSWDGHNQNNYIFCIITVVCMFEDWKIDYCMEQYVGWNVTSLFNTFSYFGCGKASCYYYIYIFLYRTSKYKGHSECRKTSTILQHKIF